MKYSSAALTEWVCACDISYRSFVINSFFHLYSEDYFFSTGIFRLTSDDDIIIKSNNGLKREETSMNIKKSQQESCAAVASKLISKNPTEGTTIPKNNYAPKRILNE